MCGPLDSGEEKKEMNNIIEMKEWEFKKEEKIEKKMAKLAKKDEKKLEKMEKKAMKKEKKQ